MAGPLPTPNPRRRNAPTIPTTKLPAGGRSAPAPDLPSWIELGGCGRAWWDWAWTTPQAAAWADGHESVVARRAQLEDDLKVEEGGRLQLLKHMLDLDDRLGLTPKGMAALRWTVVADTDEKKSETKSNVRRLKAVDPRAVAGA